MKKLFKSLEKQACGFYPFFILYHKLYRRVLQREVELAGITERDVVLNIGCGAAPFTALHVVQMTGAKVIALDKDPEAVAMARDFLKKHGLDENIDIRHGDGSPEELPFFTVAMIALHVLEKEKMLQNLQAQGPPGARLVFRQPVKAYRQEYGYFRDDIPPDRRIAQDMKTFQESFLFMIPEKKTGSTKPSHGEQTLKNGREPT